MQDSVAKKGSMWREKGGGCPVGLTCRQQFAYQLQRHTSKNVKFNIENTHWDRRIWDHRMGNPLQLAHAVCISLPLTPPAPTLTDKDKACATVDSCCLPPFDGPFGLSVGQTDGHRQRQRQAARHHRVATVAKWVDVWRLLLQLDK